jgi:hypothetical protein
MIKGNHALYLKNTNLTRLNTTMHKKQNVHYSLSSHMGLLCTAASFHSLFHPLSIKTVHSIIVSPWIQQNLSNPVMFCSLWYHEQINNTMKLTSHTSRNVFPNNHATVYLQTHSKKHNINFKYSKRTFWY